MNVEPLSHEEIALFCKDSDLLTVHVKKVRSKLIIEFIAGFKERIASFFKDCLSKYYSVLKIKRQPKKFKISAS